MPFVYFDIIRGRSRDQVRALLDSSQAAIVEAFGTPERDRYQLVTGHSPGEMVIQDNGLGIERSGSVVVIHIINRQGRKTRSQKEDLYALLARNLERDCGLDPADLVVSIIENEDEDWSIGYRKTGPLSPTPSSGRATTPPSGVSSSLARCWVRSNHSRTPATPRGPRTRT
jgi:phenylpyruvate tautomerase PptA (4-oxalocrotonate tautomerase family)